MNIKNEITFGYIYDDVPNEMLPAECVIEAIVHRPNIFMSKTAKPKQADVGDIITYTVTVEIGSGDDLYTSQYLVDNIDEHMEFIEGTLKVDDVLIENQDISRIDVNFGVDETHKVTYQCKRIY